MTDYIHEFKYSGNYYNARNDTFDGTCIRCSATLLKLIHEIEKMPEAYGHLRTDESINKFYPCISDNEFCIKNVLQ